VELQRSSYMPPQKVTAGSHHHPAATLRTLTVQPPTQSSMLKFRHAGKQLDAPLHEVIAAHVR